MNDNENAMVHIDRLQILGAGVADRMLLLFDPVTMTRKEKWLFKFAKRKLFYKLYTLVFERRLEHLPPLIAFVKENLADIELAVNRLIALKKAGKIPQCVRGPDGTYRGVPK